MIRIRWIDQDMADDQVIPLVDEGEPLPIFTAIAGLIDPSIRSTKIQMRVVLRIRCKVLCRPTIRSFRKP